MTSQLYGGINFLESLNFINFFVIGFIIFFLHVFAVVLLLEIRFWVYSPRWPQTSVLQLDEC